MVFAERVRLANDGSGGPYWHEGGFNQKWQYDVDNAKWAGHLEVERVTPID